ncbi:MAG: acyl-CoA thioesterase II [Alphaproteobacteria bacterium]|nr:acyl-CoA thioesterase II [Alphaproteobacteria bacterium]
MPANLAELLSLLDLEPIEVNIFRGVSPKNRSERVFGGQVLAQALVAANRTVNDDRLAHSLHAYFILGGDPKAPILYEVDRSRDGGSFATRRVVAIQHGRQIFNMGVSYHIDEPGLGHQFGMPSVTPPEELPSEGDRRAALAERVPEKDKHWFARERPIEQRPVEPVDFWEPEKREPIQNIWLKANGSLPDDPKLHQCILAYASDMSLLDTCLLPHGLGWMSGKLIMASLDHAMWFHTRFRMDEWLLYAQDSPAAGGARGFNRGSVFSRDGNLVASVAQEGLMRLKTR